MSVFSRFQWFLFAFVISLLIYAQLSAGQSSDRYKRCGDLFHCGELQNVAYPSRGEDRPEYCGHPGFELKCDANVPHITIESVVYRVLKIDNDNFTVAREDLWNSTCNTNYYNTTLDTNLFNYTQNNQNIAIFYGCSSPGKVQTLIYNAKCNSVSSSLYIPSGSALSDGLTCSTSIIVPASADAVGRLVMPGDNETLLSSALTSGFGLQWSADNSNCSQCIDSGGRCGYDNSTNSFSCFCNDGQYSLTCNPTQRKDNSNCSQCIDSGGRCGYDNSTNSFSCFCNDGQYSLKCNPAQRKGGSRKYIIITVIGIAIFLVAGGIALLSFTSYKRRTNNRNNIDGEAFIKQFGAVGPKQYSYSQIKKMTNSFADKLGEGGYGSVYKGKLQDGSLVAVKVLSGKKGNGEDFINEVASISRTSHVNIVTLLGFCFHKDRRALIFQFMPNGSLDKFAYRNRSSDSDIGMDCKTLFKIAVGVSRGLEYLHRGCNTRIVHFDIKPHNILLDEEFCPKISDFGLAKLSQTKESMFSKLSARGTIGYMAPEMIFRNFGGISPKSDVYSYGMMILEMVGVRTNPRVEVDRSSQLYFPNWIYEQLELGNDLEIEVLEDEEEEEMARKLILVGLWCIQTKPPDRPSMSKVVEMLEGSLLSLQFPPKPLLYTPPSSPQESSPQPSSTSLS